MLTKNLKKKNFIVLFLFSMFWIFSAKAQTLHSLYQEMEASYKKGEYNAAISIGEQLLVIARMEIGETHGNYANILNVLALSYANKGDLSRAESYYNKALEIFKSTVGSQSLYYASTLNNLAQLYQDMARNNEAEALYKQAIQIKKTKLGDQNLKYADNLNRLAKLYLLQNRLREAESLFRQVLFIREKQLGTKDLHYASSLHNLAGALHLQNKLDEAETFYLKALGIKKENLGPNHLSCASTLNDLAGLYQRAGVLDVAGPYFKEALQIRRKQLGTEHPDYATSLHNLAGWYLAKGDLVQAESHYRRALEIRKKHLDSQHKDYKESLEAVSKISKSSSTPNLENFFQSKEYRQLLFEAISKKALRSKKQSQASSPYEKGTGNETVYIVAKELLKKFEEASGKGNNHPDYALELNGLAGIFKSMGFYHEVEPLYLEALQILQSSRGQYQTSYGIVLNNLAELYLFTGKYLEADSLLNKAKVVIKDQLGDQDLYYGIIVNNLGSLYQAVGRYQDGKQYFEEALSIFKMHFMEKPLQYAQSLNNLGALYREIGNYSKAEALHKESVEIHRTQLGKQHSDYAKSLDHLAGLYLEIGRYDESETMFHEVVQIRKIYYGDSPLEYAVSLNNLAMLYKIMGRYVEAERLYLLSFEIINNQVEKGHPYYILSRGNLAEIYALMGYHSKAETLSKEVLQLLDLNSGSQERTRARTLTNLAIIYKNISLYDKAESLYKEALDKIKVLLGDRHIEYAQIQNDLGLMLHTIGRHEEAKRLFNHSLHILNNQLGVRNIVYATTLNNLAIVHQTMDQYKEAEGLFKNAMAILRDQVGQQHPDYATILHNLGTLYLLQGNFTEASSFLQSSLQSYKSLIELSFSGLSDSQRHDFFNYQIKNLFESYFSFLKKSNSQESGFAYSNVLFTKGLLLSAQLNMRQVILKSGNPSLLTLWQKYQNLHASMARWINLSKQELNDRGIDMEQEWEAINNLEKRLSRISGFDLSTKEVSWQDVQRKLKAGEAAVEIVRFRSHDQDQLQAGNINYAALILTATVKAPKIIYLENGKELEQKSYTNYLNSRFDLKDSLYAKFWAPIQEELDGIKRVYISTDGIYNQINLDILSIGNKGTYLSDRIEFVILTSTRDLVLRENREKIATTDPILIGGVQYDKGNGPNQGNWPYLFGSLREIKNIQAVLKKQALSPKIKTNREASEQAVLKIANPYIFHIATHGYFKKSEYDQLEYASFQNYYAWKNRISKWTLDPMLRSGLILASSDATQSQISGMDGQLTAYEIANQMDLRGTELVVLSGCDTGKGGNQYGEGIYGLQRAFQVAGAQSIIMSLWPVQDQVAEEFFSAFYTNWLEKAQSKRAAFNMARDQIRKDWEDPGHWGAFVFVGL